MTTIIAHRGRRVQVPPPNRIPSTRKEERNMATAIINGRRVQVPPVAQIEDIRKAGGIDRGRSVIRRTREGNYVVRPGEQIAVQDGDTFVDAPPRVKGRPCLP